MTHKDGTTEHRNKVVVSQQHEEASNTTTAAESPATSPTSTTSPITVTIVGGGNSAHVLIPFLSATGHTVHLLTRRPTVWKKTVTVDIHCDDKKGKEDRIVDTIRGSLGKISSNPADVIPEADAVILCMPVHQYRHALCNIGPHLSKTKAHVYVGTIYGQAGFHWMVHDELERKLGLEHVVTFAVGLIPWICRTDEYGSKGSNYGGKYHNIVAVSPPDMFEPLQELLLDDICYKFHKTGKFLQACSFLSLTLSVDNQIIHPSRCYGLWKTSKDNSGKWDSFEDIPYFYKDFDQVSADILKKVDDDYTKVRDAVRQHFPSRDFTYMLDYLALERFTHNSTNVDIQASFAESKQLSKIKTPCVPVVEEEKGAFMLDISCRFFTDDIPYGLLIAKWIASQLHVETPMVDEIILWAQRLRGEAFLDPTTHEIILDNCLAWASGIPPAYGITSIDEIVD